MTKPQMLGILAQRGYTWTTMASNRYVLKTLTTPDGLTWNFNTTTEGQAQAKKVIESYLDKEASR